MAIGSMIRATHFIGTRQASWNSLPRNKEAPSECGGRDTGCPVPPSQIPAGREQPKGRSDNCDTISFTMNTRKAER